MCDNMSHVKGIADELNAIGYGNMYICPSCGEMIHWDDAKKVMDDGDSIPYCPDCDDSELEPCYMSDWFQDRVYNTEYRISSRHDDMIKSVAVMVAYGGPNIWVDTNDEKVKLYWGLDYAEYPITGTAADEITTLFNEVWQNE